MSKHVNEEVKYIKYLSNYKRGLVISEQESDDIVKQGLPTRPAIKSSTTTTNQIPDGTPTNSQVKETKDLSKEVEELKQQISMLSSIT